MTHKEALYRVKGYLTDIIPAEDYSEVEEIIKALEQQPCDDAVSRKAVDELSKELVHTTRDKADFLCNFWEGLQKLPPVTPQQKYGKWISLENRFDLGDRVKCSECGQVFVVGDDVSRNYCPNCGARMVEPQESEE